jgi:hypothetical protein
VELSTKKSTSAAACGFLHAFHSAACACSDRYFDPETVGLDFKGMTADLEAAPEGSLVVLHGEESMLQYFNCVTISKLGTESDITRN